MDDAVTNITDRNQGIGDTIYEGMMLRLGCTFTAISFCRLPSARYLSSVPVLGCVRLLYFDSKMLWRDVLFPLNRSMNIDFCGRMFEVVFTPGLTPGSTTFVDKDAAYGFSGDSFGSGNLLLGVDFSTLISTCKKMSAVIEKYDIKYLYPGHYFGMNKETPQRVKDMITMSEDILSGKAQGEPNPQGMLGLDRVYTKYGVRINYKKESMK